MKTATDKNGSPEPAETEAPGQIFHDDAMVIDYLNALLTAAPPEYQDSREIHLLNLAREAGWKLPGISKDGTGQSVNFDAEYAIQAAETLRTENRNLKYSVELAEIDVQVLRSENSTLKTEIATLQEILLKLKQTVDALAAKNDVLTSQLQSYNNPPDLTQHTMTHDRPAGHAAVDPGPAVEAGEEKYPGTATDELTGSDETTAETEIPLPDDPDSPHAVSSDNDGLTVNNSSGIDPDRAIIAQALPENSSKPAKSDRTGLIMSHTLAVSGSALQSNHTVSRVIKSQQLKKHRHDVRQPVTITPLKPVDSDDVTGESTLQTREVTQPPPRECKPEHSRITTPDPQQDLLHPDHLGDIDEEPAPAPQVIIRKNVKNYEDLQNEAESPKTAPTGHTIVL